MNYRYVMIKKKYDGGKTMKKIAAALMSAGVTVTVVNVPETHRNILDDIREQRIQDDNLNDFFSENKIAIHEENN